MNNFYDQQAILPNFIVGYYLNIITTKVQQNLNTFLNILIIK